MFDMCDLMLADFFERERATLDFSRFSRAARPASLKALGASSFYLTCWFEVTEYLECDLTDTCGEARAQDGMGGLPELGLYDPHAEFWLGRMDNFCDPATDACSDPFTTFSLSEHMLLATENASTSDLASAAANAFWLWE